MQVGDLVKVKRASIGVPMGSIGLILRSFKPRADYAQGRGDRIHEVQVYGAKVEFNRRFLGRDLELINASR